jgi:hypothetical protein
MVQAQCGVGIPPIMLHALLKGALCDGHVEGGLVEVTIKELRIVRPRPRLFLSRKAGKKGVCV